MSPFRPQAPKLPVKERASFRLATLFVGTFVGMVILLIASAVFGALADSQRANAEAEILPAPLVIDQKIQSDLSKAMSFDAEPPTIEVQNPFVDRAGLSGGQGITNGTVGPQQASTSSTTGVNPTAPAGSQPQSPTTQSGVLQIGPAVVSDTRSRHDEWFKRLQAGEYVGPESETLAVEDLIPVGYTSGGNRSDEVMFFSQALCVTFSFPAGTRFYDGWLTSLDQNEVVFSFGNGIRRKSYSHAAPCAPTQGQQAIN
jgi:hypothetical protein